MKIEYKNEFNLIKDRFTRLSEFIKDVRFRKNIGKEVKKTEFKKMSNQIDFSKKQSFNESDCYKERRSSLNNIHNENNYFKRSNTSKNNLMGNIINSLNNNYDKNI